MKHTLGKKAQSEGEGGSFGVAIGIALMVIAVIIFVPLIYKGKAFASQLGDDTTCYASIAGSMLSTQESGAKCPITYYKVYNNKITQTKEETTSDSTIIKDFSAGDNKVNELFAKLLGSCLQRGGGANSRAFGRTWFGSSTVCLECADVEFDPSVGKQTFGDLRKFLEDNNVPGQTKKYSDALTKTEQHRDDWVNFGLKNHILPGGYGDTISKNNAYVIFFMGIKEGTATALAINGRILGREDVYFVYAAPQETFDTLCERKVN